MLSRILPVALLCAALGWASTLAQPKPSDPDLNSKADVKPESKSEGKDESLVFELRMIDGTLMKVVLLDKSMTVATKYGKLIIPATDIRRLEFGFRYPEGVEAKVEKAVAELGSPEFQTREEAEKQLLKVGLHAIPSLRRAMKSSNPEVLHRSEAALKKLEGKLEEGKPELNDYDVVETAEFTVKGRLVAGMMSVRTKYFGETTLNFTDIRSFISVGHSFNVELTLDAAKYGKMSQSDWMETTITVSAGQQ